MQVQLLVERDQNECIVKLAGRSYRFKRNENGHLVSDITDLDHIKWVSDPMHNTSFRLYSVPERNVIEEVIEDVVVEQVEEKVVAGAEPGILADTSGTIRPPYPQKGSKRPPKE
ncbi:MAG: hypothetical protein ACOYOS_00110 [Syntrophales bacterium]